LLALLRRYASARKNGRDKQKGEPSRRNESFHSSNYSSPRARQLGKRAKLQVARKYSNGVTSVGLGGLFHMEKVQRTAGAGL
jgi:hypothetical protein